MPQLDIITYLSANFWLTLVITVLVYKVGMQGIPFIYTTIIYKYKKERSGMEMIKNLSKVKIGVEDRVIY